MSLIVTPTDGRTWLACHSLCEMYSQLRCTHSFLLDNAKLLKVKRDTSLGDVLRVVLEEFSSKKATLPLVEILKGLEQLVRFLTDPRGMSGSFRFRQ